MVVIKSGELFPQPFVALCHALTCYPWTTLHISSFAWLLNPSLTCASTKPRIISFRQLALLNLSCCACFYVSKQNAIYFSLSNTFFFFFVFTHNHLCASTSICLKCINFFVSKIGKMCSKYWPSVSYKMMNHLRFAVPYFSSYYFSSLLLVFWDWMISKWQYTLLWYKCCLGFLVLFFLCFILFCHKGDRNSHIWSSLSLQNNWYYW